MSILKKYKIKLATLNNNHICGKWGEAMEEDCCVTVCAHAADGYKLARPTSFLDQLVVSVHDNKILVYADDLFNQDVLIFLGSYAYNYVKERKYLKTLHGAKNGRI